jgi:acetylornithine deacetylase/succinyl-diaminopimelate desuccinylase-like protein
MPTDLTVIARTCELWGHSQWRLEPICSGPMIDPISASAEASGLAALESLEGALMDFVVELVRLPSLPGDEGPTQDRVARALAAMGLEVTILPCPHEALAEHPAFCDDGFDPVGRVDVIGRLPGSGADRGQGSLVLNGHVDVVPTGDPWLRDHPPRLSWIEGQFESGATALDHPFVQAVVAARAAGDAPPPVHGVTYGSDLRLFTNHAHMPAVLYGPGDLEAAHAVDESVATQDIMAAAATSVRLLVRWCGGALP